MKISPLKISSSLILAVAILLSCSGCRTAAAAAKPSVLQPSQPTKGPGGSDYPHGGYRMHHYGQGGDEYWIFEPADPRPKSAPVVALLHGWGGMNPRIYGAWIEHLARKGNIVIFPRYQESLRTKPATMTPAAISAIKDALRRQETESGRAIPEKNYFTVAGHSLGATIAANIAATAEKEGLPKVRAALIVEPGDATKAKKFSGAFKRGPASIFADFSSIPGDTLMVFVVGDKDAVVGDATAKNIYAGATSVSARNKIFLLANSDYRGSPPMEATHFFPSASKKDMDVEIESKPAGPIREKIRSRLKERMNERAQNQDSESNEGAETSEGLEGTGRGAVDAMDYFITWRLLDAINDCAFRGKNCSIARAESAGATSTGLWSDGVAVKILSHVKNPTESKND